MKSLFRLTASLSLLGATLPAHALQYKVLAYSGEVYILESWTACVAEAAPLVGGLFGNVARCRRQQGLRVGRQIRPGVTRNASKPRVCVFQPGWVTIQVDNGKVYTMKGHAPNANCHSLVGRVVASSLVQAFNSARDWISSQISSLFAQGITFLEGQLRKAWEGIRKWSCDDFVKAVTPIATPVTSLLWSLIPGGYGNICHNEFTAGFFCSIPGTLISAAKAVKGVALAVWNNRATCTKVAAGAAAMMLPTLGAVNPVGALLTCGIVYYLKDEVTKAIENIKKVWNCLSTLSGKQILNLLLKQLTATICNTAGSIAFDIVINIITYGGASGATASRWPAKVLLILNKIKTWVGKIKPSLSKKLISQLFKGLPVDRLPRQVLQRIEQFLRLPNTEKVVEYLRKQPGDFVHKLLKDEFKALKKCGGDGSTSVLSVLEKMSVGAAQAASTAASSSARPSSSSSSPSSTTAKAGVMTRSSYLFVVRNRKLVRSRTVVRKAQPVGVVAKKGTACGIRYTGRGRPVSGWVACKYIRFVGAPTPSRPAAAPASPSRPSANGYAGVISADKLAFRTGPSKRYRYAASFRYLTRGTRVTVLGKQGTWYKVSYRGKTGYVWQYVQRASGSAGATTRSPSRAGYSAQSASRYSPRSTSRRTPARSSSSSAKAKAYGQVTAWSLKFYSRPSTSAPAVRGMPSLRRGTRVGVLGKRGHWFKVTYRGATGYVYRSLRKVP